MSGYPTSSTPIKRIGFSEFCEVNGREFRRKAGAQQWIEVPREKGSPEGSTEPSLRISLVQQEQVEGEPLHWSLFVAREGQAGLVYQVKGDAEFMTYRRPSHRLDITTSASFVNIYNLAIVTEQQARIVKQAAEQERPPGAPNRQAVTENSQGWTVRVIANLVDRDIIENSKLEMARSMVEQI